MRGTRATISGGMKLARVGVAIGAFTLGGATDAAAQVQGASTGTAIFYTASSTVIVAFFSINFALKNWVGVYYAALFALMLGVVWVIEGGLSAVPGLSEGAAASLGLSIGLVAAGVGMLTAERAIDLRRELTAPRRTLKVLAAVSFFLIAPAWIWPSAPIAMATNILLAAMFASHAFSTSTWRKLDNKPNRASQLIATALAVAILAIFLIYLFDSKALASGTLRTLYAVATVPSMGTIVLALIDMRRSHERALEAALKAARKDAATSAALLEMEKNYSRARDIAASRTRQISTASHDIRQPIASMRAELDVLKSEARSENVARLDRILSHLSALTDDLSRSVGKTGEPDIATEEQAESIPAAHVFKMLEKMFAAEAKAGGAVLRIVPSTQVFEAPAVALMRIATNLVSNAINHANATKILVGLRRRGGKLRLLIADNGVGVTASRQDALFKAGAKGSHSKGSGLGLSIVRELAERHEFELDARLIEGKGAAFTITIPAAR